MKTKQDIEEKRLLALDRERDRLWARSRQMVALEKPIQRGWRRCYFLTPEAEQRPDRAVLEAILGSINLIRYHWRRDFSPPRRRRRARLQEMHQELGRISLTMWQSRYFPAEFRKYFFVESVFRHTRWVQMFRFRWLHLYELRTVPNMVHQLPLLDPVAQSRSDEIRHIFDNPRKSGRLLKLKGRRRWFNVSPRTKMLERLAEKRMRAALAGDVEAEERAGVCVCTAALLSAS